jgi:adenosylcobinamide-phosphate synthase
MSFISVLFALLLEQARPLIRGNAIHAAMRAWVRWCSLNFDAGKPLHGWLAWGLAVVGPSALAFVIYVILGVYVAWPLALLWSALVLYASLGFRQFSFHFTQIRDALAEGDDALARRLLADWQQIEVKDLPRGEVVGKVIEFSVLAAHRHVFGVLAWFSVLAALGLGPAGAVVYRLSEFVARYWHHQSESHHQPVSPALRDNAHKAWNLIDWIPARVTAIGFAVVGNFEEAIDGWRRYTQRDADVSDNDGLVLAATAGAVNIQLRGVADRAGLNQPLGSTLSGEDVGSSRPVPELQHLAILVGLVWRTVVMWVVLLALLTLARLLG